MRAFSNCLWPCCGFDGCCGCCEKGSALCRCRPKYVGPDVCGLHVEKGCNLVHARDRNEVVLRSLFAAVRNECEA